MTCTNSWSRACTHAAIMMYRYFGADSVSPSSGRESDRSSQAVILLPGLVSMFSETASSTVEFVSRYRCIVASDSSLACHLGALSEIGRLHERKLPSRRLSLCPLTSFGGLPFPRRLVRTNYGVDTETDLLTRMGFVQRCALVLEPFSQPRTGGAI